MRLWYRITPAETTPEVTVKPEVKVEEQPNPPKVTTPPPQTTPEDAVNITSRNQPPQRASLVDITRSLQCWNSTPKKEPAPERIGDLISPAKRRKRDKPIPVKRPPPIAPTAKPPPPPPVSTTTIFDPTRPEEFSCSTPIPAGIVQAVKGTEDADSDANNKPLDWLPKAVFDLDDRALLAKRLQNIIPSDDVVTIKTEEPEAVDEKATTESPVVVVQTPPTKEQPETLLDPLTIVTSTTDDPAEEAVHDSVGALDLSGSSSRSDADPSPSPAAAASGSSPVGSSSTTKIGPHPFFMTPSSIYIQQQQQQEDGVCKKEKKKKKKMLWDLFQPSSPAPNGSLLSLIQKQQQRPILPAPVSKPSN